MARETGVPVERLRTVEARYAQPRPATEWRWRNETPVDELPEGRDLVIESPVPFTLHCGWDGWQDTRDLRSLPGAFGLWLVHFHAAELRAHATLEFTRLFEGGWEGVDHEVKLQHHTLAALTTSG